VAASLDKISRPPHIRGMTLPRAQPIIPTWRKEPFGNPDWLFDFKYDGFRALCYLEQARCRLISLQCTRRSGRARARSR
jgi:ATP-dependent DNA ligase